MALTKRKSVKDKERDLGSREKMPMQEVTKEMTTIACQERTSKARKFPRK